MDEKTKVNLRLAELLEEAIKESGEKGIPSGHLYNMLMQSVSLEDYQALIEILKKAGKIKESDYLLTAI